MTSSKFSLQVVSCENELIFLNSCICFVIWWFNEFCLRAFASSVPDTCPGFHGPLPKDTRGSNYCFIRFVLMVGAHILFCCGMITANRLNFYF
jgi:hypothetical protein